MEFLRNLNEKDFSGNSLCLERWFYFIPMNASYSTYFT